MFAFLQYSAARASMFTTIMTTHPPYSPSVSLSRPHSATHAAVNPSVHLHADGLMTARRLAEIVLGESPFDAVVRAIERVGQRLLPNFSREDVVAEMFRDFRNGGSDDDASRVAEALRDKPFKVWCPLQAGHSGEKSFLLFI